MTGDTSPQVPLTKFKRTKMIATLGPSTDTYASVEGLLKEGVNGFRLNFSHGTHEEHAERVKWIRKASAAAQKPVAIIQDLQGPKVRLGDFEGTITLLAKQEIQLGHKANWEQDNIIPMQIDLTKVVHRGERIYINDGKVKGVINGVSPAEGTVRVQITQGGVVSQRKGLNLPDTDFEGHIITVKDKKDITFGVDHDIDYVALSFVQHADDVTQLKRILKNLGSEAKIIAKIETKAATDNIEEIVQVSDAVMVARGDLASETLPESVPVLQRQIIGLALKYHRVSIVATQMLASMTETPEPTRAEVSDVATAVIVGADTVMLSDETASGKYPMEAVQVMKRIILYTQEHSPLKPIFFTEPTPSVPEAIASTIITLAERIGAKAIVAATNTGDTALAIAAHRPRIPMIAVTASERVAQQLAIVHGGKTYVRPSSNQATTKLTDWLREKKLFKKGDIVVTASGKYADKVGGTDTIDVRVLD